MLPRDVLATSLRDAEKPALVAFVTAGFPDPDGFLPLLTEIAEAADAVEVGVPFTDPMADGVTIQRSSQVALANGVSLAWILEQLAEREVELGAPILLMSYLNPLLAFGYDSLAERAVQAGVSGFIVPDLPYEESAPLHEALDVHGLALVQLVTPATPPDRLRALCQSSEGFVYAVTRTGITGAAAELPSDAAEYLAAVSAASDLPVCAGFGVRARDQVEEIGNYADGVIVGSALIEALERGESPAAFLDGLRPR
ncbi:MAG: tryptophan synthase subunit alpha [Gammaproteobacteria bacterium]|nr:tryptophan synthase subunit alpha [Gammaproteobacteria bacterium]